MTSTKKKLVITEGPIFIKMLRYSIPVMLTSVLQTLYNMADNAVVGQFSGDPNALGSVGSTTSLNNLILNLMLGVSIGTSVAVAQAYGAKNEKLVSKVAHTALSFAVIVGIVLMVAAIIASRPVLMLMGTQDSLLEGAVLYLRIIALGLPASAVYNVAAGTLRSVGDSRTPLIILMCTGLVNVALNFVFVCGFGMTVDGVAIATISAQYLSATAAVFTLWKRRSECYGFSFKKLCIDTPQLKRILLLGVPAALQNVAFSLSNVLLVSGVNTLGEHAIKANTIATQVDAITYIAATSFGTAAMVFAGQNYGAKKYDRIKRVLGCGLIQATIFGVMVGQLFLIFSDQVASIFISATDPNKAEILAITKELVTVILTTYFLCGIMGIVSSVLRGLGYSISPMIIAIVTICGIRITWRYLVFPTEAFNTLGGLYTCFPISWIVATLCYLVVFIYAWRKIKKQKVIEIE